MELQGAQRVGAYEVGGGWELQDEGAHTTMERLYQAIEPYIGRYLS